MIDSPAISQIPDQTTELDDRIKKALKVVKEKLEQGEKSVRDGIVRDAKRLEMFWRGIQNAYWSEVAHDWRVPSSSDLQDLFPGMTDVNSKVINIYKAYGESIIAAMTVGLPVTRFFPDDADNPEDLTASKSFTKIAEKVEIDNDALLLFVRALYILFNQHFVAAYNYHDTAEKYGTIKQKELQPKLDDLGNPVMDDVQHLECPSCGTPHPEDGEVLDENGTMQCQNCTIPDIPVMGTHQEPAMEESIYEIPRSQECIEVYGPLHVNIPSYCRKLEDSPYLIFETEQHFALMQKVYPEIADKIKGTPNTAKSDRWARNTDRTGKSNEQLVTVSKCWFRDWAFNILELDQENGADLSELCKTEYPKGVCVVFVDGIYAESFSDSMDDHWTVSESPVSENLFPDPIGSVIAPIQELKTEIDDLTIETIRKSIPESFIDPKVVNMAEYQKAPAVPGLTFPAIPRSGQKLSDAFFERTKATMSREFEEYQNRLTEDGQFVSGADAAIYGGAQAQGSGTASEYNTRRNQALQRLSLRWKMLNIWWPKVMGKCVKSSVEAVKSSGMDSRFVKRIGDSYVNVWIRRSELTGSVGLVKSDTSEQFPISAGQKRGLLVDLLGMKLDPIMAMLFHPDNMEIVQDVLAFSELTIPGASDREKQLGEIAELLKASPMSTGDPMPGQMPMPPQSSVLIDRDFDNHAIHMETIKSWANSEQGIDAKVTVPNGYMNVLAHYREHVMAQNEQMMQEAQKQMMSQPPANGGGKDKPIGDISGPPSSVN